MSVLAWTQLLIAVVTVASLGLSTYSLYLRQKDQRSSLKLETGYGIDPRHGHLFSVKLVNTGKVPVTATEIYLLLGEDEEGNERRAYMPTLATGGIGSSSLPCRLDSGEPANFHTPLEQLRNDLHSEGFEQEARVTVVAKDSIGNVYEGPANFRLG